MASEVDHIALANRNHNTLMFLLTKHHDHPEWIATIAFYKAVHIAEAVFHSRWKYDSKNHDDRRDRIKRMLPRKYFQHFESLYQKSRVARYLQDSSTSTPYYRFSDHITPDDVVRELIAKRLVTLEQMSLEFLSDTMRTTLRQIHIPDLPA